MKSFLWRYAHIYKPIYRSRTQNLYIIAEDKELSDVEQVSSRPECVLKCKYMEASFYFKKYN